MKILPLETKSVCTCPRPKLTADYEVWIEWVHEHRRVCKPRRIVDLPLPEIEDENA